ncbi:MAG TPA: hypothetical protein VGP99_02770 [Tepidisphaeraceae bacterium]|jgi:hypothetical protein|nr:hypothetical protein [Tepidisphaeraceae bacterium]
MSEQNDPTISTTDQNVAHEGPIVARYGRYYRNTRYLMFLLFMGFGIASIWHGFWVYPEENRVAIARGQRPPHGEFDAPLNKVLGIALPPLSVFVLLRALHNSRGEYRLEGEALYIPGHPPIPLSAIRKIDKALWDRKGIAYIEYEVGEPPVRGTFKLDDFVYEREPTDQIMARIEAYAASLAPAAADTSASA